MQQPIHDIINSAYSLGACRKLDKISDYRTLVAAFFSPQGQEFCEKYCYPSIEALRDIKDEVKPRGVYVDCGYVEIKGKKNVCLAGNTHAEIYVSGVRFTHTVVLMHGASATINAENYAVVKVVNIGGGKVHINKDKTVVVL